MAVEEVVRGGWGWGCGVTTIAVAILAFTAQLRAVDPSSSDTLSLNKGDSHVSFTIYGRALWPIKREGSFKKFAGGLSYDSARPSDARVDLTVYTASIDMNNTGQDELLRSEDFFDVDRFPTMHFKGTIGGVNAGRPLATADGALTVMGDLTIRGITKRISTPVTFRSDDGKRTAVFETTFQIDRTDFGLNGAPKWGGFKVSIAKNVQIHIAIATVDGGQTSTP